MPTGIYLSIPVPDIVPICGPPVSAVIWPQIYISSPNYPDPMPADTDLNCSCSIQSYSEVDDVLIEGQIEAVHMELTGSVSDPCRERLNIEGRFPRGPPVLCPDDPSQGYKYTVVNHTLWSFTMFRKEIAAEIHLVTNRSTGSDRAGRFLLRLSAQCRQVTE